MKHVLYLFTTILFSISQVNAQETAFAANNQSDDSEIIKINTAAGQINLSIEDAELKDCLVRVFDNGVEGENIKVTSPADKPINVVIIVAMNPVKKWKLRKENFYKEIEMLQTKTPGMNVQTIYTVKESEEFKTNLKFNNAVEFENLSLAVKSATNLLQQTTNRKAILVLTNEVEALKTDVIAQTNADLGKTSAMVYLMSINNTVKRNEKKVQARTNINGGSILIKKEDYLGGMFRSFKRLAGSLHTVSYEYNVSRETAGDHRVTATVARGGDKFEVAKNIRQFNVGGEIQTKSETVQNTTVAQNAVGTTFTKVDDPQTVEEITLQEIGGQTLEELLDSRPEKMSSIQIDGYVEELKRRSEMKGVKIYGGKDKLVKAVRQNIQPVLKAYDREIYTRIIVYKSKNPFIALYRESILLISSAALGMLTDEEVRNSVAHELAHELYGDELKSADQSNDNARHQIVEHKCDLVAALVMKNLQDDPFAIVVAAEKFASWYARNMPTADIGADRAPTSLKREKCISMFLQNNVMTIAAK